MPMTRDELREWMKKHRWSVPGLAAQLEVHPTTVQRWRSGGRRLPGDLAVRLRAIEIMMVAEADGSVVWPGSERAIHARQVRNRARPYG